MARNPAAVAKALLRANSPTGTQPGVGGFGGAPATVPAGTSPLVASYGEWTTGRTPGRGLPRDLAAFTTGAFGPLVPMVPTPVDTPGPGDERPEPRRFQYPVSWNIPHGQPGDEGLKLSSFANLRTIADTYSVARACITVRKDELLGLGWDVVPTKAAEKTMRGDRAARREFDERRAKMMKFWRRPDADYFAFRDWFSVLLETVLVLDALAVYMQPSRVRGKGVAGSNLGQLAAIDGSTIRPLLDVHGARPRSPNPAYQQYLYGVPRSDLMSLLAGEDVADMGDALTQEYRGDQLIYRPQTPRDWTPYGFPPIERALVPILSGIQRQQFQLDFFAEGTIPGLFVTNGDPNATPNQNRELQDALNAMAGDPAWKHKIIVLPGGSQTMPQRPADLAGVFDEIVMTQVCMAFSVMPMELGISPKVSTSQSSGAANQMAKASQNTMERKANRPTLEWFADIFNHVIQGVCRQDDMQWWWEGLEEDEDEQTKTDIQAKKVSIGLMSVDEARVENGQQPWGLPMTSDPVLIAPTGVIPFGSIDPGTGQPAGLTPKLTAAPPPPGTPPPGGGPGDGGEASTPAEPSPPKPTGPVGSPAPAPKPTTAPGKPQPAATPAHAGAQAHDRTAGQQPNAAAAKPQAAASKGVDTFAALRELDLIRRRITKGRGVADWTPEHIPAGVFTRLTRDAPALGEQAVTHARTTVKAFGRAQRRDAAVAPARQRIVDGLRGLAAGVVDGSVPTASFVDRAVRVLRDGYRHALGVGTAHATADLTRDVAVKAAGPDWVASYDSRFFQYGQQAQVGYEEGYGLTTVASGTGNWLARWDATSTDPCELCDARDGKTFTIGQVPGYPGMGGFGNVATVCRGGPNCHCQVTYLHTPDGQGTPTGAAPTPVDATAAAVADAARQDMAATQVAARRALTATHPTLVDGAGSIVTDPQAYGRFLDTLADRRAEQQRPHLVGLLQDLLTSATQHGGQEPRAVTFDRPDGGHGGHLGGIVAGTVIAGGVAAAIAGQQASQQQATPATQPADTDQLNTATAATKGAADPGDPNPVDAEHILSVMVDNFPPKALRWVKAARWIGPVAVPYNRVDTDDADSWAASGQPDRVEHFANELTKGRPVKPAICVQEPGENKVKVIDGHHRYLGAVKAGEPFRCYIGFVDTDGGPWDQTHSFQVHSGDHPANKRLAPAIAKVGPKGYIHGWIYVGPQAAGARVVHPHHGAGVIDRHEDGRTHVRFDSGTEHSFETGRVTPAGGEHFQPRTPADEATLTNERPLLSEEQYRSMAPDPQWSTDKRDRILNALRSTAEGRVLADTLDRFQDGGSIVRIRSNVDKRLAGAALGPTSASRAEALIGALRHAPADWAPTTLYRGMSIKGTVANVLAKYQPGQPLDLNLTSFTSDRAVAKRFQWMTQKTGTTRVTVELVGEGKRVLPLQNLARDRRLFREKEWVSGGRYEIVDAKRSPVGGVLVRIKQVEPL